MHSAGWRPFPASSGSGGADLRMRPGARRTGRSPPAKVTAARVISMPAQSASVGLKMREAAEPPAITATTESPHAIHRKKGACAAGLPSLDENMTPANAPPDRIPTGKCLQECCAVAKLLIQVRSSSSHRGWHRPCTISHDRGHHRFKQFHR
jgi:hypothetical protein